MTAPKLTEAQRALLASADPGDWAAEGEAMIGETIRQWFTDNGVEFTARRRDSLSALIAVKLQHAEQQHRDAESEAERISTQMRHQQATHKEQLAAREAELAQVRAEEAERENAEHRRQRVMHKDTVSRQGRELSVAEAKLAKAVVTLRWYVRGKGDGGVRAYAALRALGIDLSKETP